MSKVAWRNRPKHIERACPGCGTPIVGESVAAFEEATAEHYAAAHNIPRRTS